MTHDDNCNDSHDDHMPTPPTPPTSSPKVTQHLESETVLAVAAAATMTTHQHFDQPQSYSTRQYSNGSMGLRHDMSRASGMFYFILLLH